MPVTFFWCTKNELRGKHPSQTRESVSALIPPVDNREDSHIFTGYSADNRIWLFGAAQL